MHIMIVDDAPLLHDLLPPRFRERGVQVSQARSTKELYTQLEQGVLPDVILLDIAFPDEGQYAGLTAAKMIRRRYPHIGLLALSKYNELRIAKDMMDLKRSGTGGVGYLDKDEVRDVDELLANATTIASGGICIDMNFPGVASAGTKLTAIQRQVVELIARGRTNKGIAERLKISEGAVERHIAAIRRLYELPSPEEERKLQVNIRILILLAYLADNSYTSDDGAE